MHLSFGPRAPALCVVENQPTCAPAAARPYATSARAREPGLSRARPRRSTLLIGRVAVGTFAAILWECVFTVLY